MLHNFFQFCQTMFPLLITSQKLIHVNSSLKSGSNFEWIIHDSCSSSVTAGCSVVFSVEYCMYVCMWRGNSACETVALKMTRKCLNPNSSIYWIVANIPGSGTLTKPRPELTSAANHRRKSLCSFSVSFIHKSPALETECLFEEILFS